MKALDKVAKPLRNLFSVGLWMMVMLLEITCF